MSTKNPDQARSDSKLLRLPISVMREILRQSAEPGMRYVDILDWLKKEHGVSSSPRALSDALTSLTRRVRSADREEAIQDWIADEKAAHPELTDEDLFTRGQRKFSLLSIAEEDSESWVKIQKTGQDARKLALLEKKAIAFDQAKQVVESTLSPDEQRARLKEILQ